MPARTCSEIRAEVKKPSAKTTSTKLGTLRSVRKIDGMTWYQRKIWTSSGMLRKSSVQALPRNTKKRLGVVRRIPISEPKTSATISESTATEIVQPHADIIQRRYVSPPPVSRRKTCQSHLPKRTPLLACRLVLVRGRANEKRGADGSAPRWPHC